jgi:hypothetical protein
MLASQGADGGYVRNWDTAAQVYLSIFALQRNGQTGQMPASFGKVRNSLAFPDAYNSPRSFTGPYDSTEPAAKKSPRQDVQGTLEKLLGTLSVQEVGNKTSE